VNAGHPVEVSTAVRDGRLGDGPAHTAVIPTLVRVPELTWLSPSRRISLHQSTPHGKHRVPSNADVCTHLSAPHSHEARDAAFQIRIGSESRIGITRCDSQSTNKIASVRLSVHALEYRHQEPFDAFADAEVL
jgi:hypothetical protein